MDNKRIVEVTESDMYNTLKKLMTSYEQNEHEEHPFYQLLSSADDAISTFMELAEEGKWYDDRNAFLKGQDLMQEDHLIMAIKPITTGMKKKKLPEQIKNILHEAEVAQ